MRNSSRRVHTDVQNNRILLAISRHTHTHTLCDSIFTRAFRSRDSPLRSRALVTLHNFVNSHKIHHWERRASGMLKISDNHLRRTYSTTTTSTEKNVVRLRHGNTRGARRCDSQDWWRVSACGGVEVTRANRGGKRSVTWHTTIYILQSVFAEETEPFCVCTRVFALVLCLVCFPHRATNPTSHTHLCLAVRIWSDSADRFDTSMRFLAPAPTRTRALPTPKCRNSP